MIEFTTAPTLTHDRANTNPPSSPECGVPPVTDAPLAPLVEVLARLNLPSLGINPLHKLTLALKHTQFARSAAL